MMLAVRVRVITIRIARRRIYRIVIIAKSNTKNKVS